MLPRNENDFVNHKLYPNGWGQYTKWSNASARQEKYRSSPSHMRMDEGSPLHASNVPGIRRTVNQERAICRWLQVEHQTLTEETGILRCKKTNQAVPGWVGAVYEKLRLHFFVLGRQLARLLIHHNPFTAENGKQTAIGVTYRGS